MSIRIHNGARPVLLRSAGCWTGDGGSTVRFSICSRLMSSSSGIRRPASVLDRGGTLPPAARHVETEFLFGGVVRLHLDTDSQGGEYAVIVRSAMKGHGLGWLLMRRMIDYAKAIGLKRIHGQVLAENTTMLSMCRHLGFHIADDPSSRDIKVVILALVEDTVG